MITIYRNARRIIKNVPDFCGLSSDEKPMDAKNGSTFLEIDTGNTFKFDEEGKNWYEQPQSGGGSGGTTDYTQLENKPSINGITLDGNQTTEELDIIPVVDLGEISGKPPIQITLNAEQIQTMQKDNCIVTALFQDLNLCLRKIGNFDTEIVFSGILYKRSTYFLVSGLQGTFNVFDIAQIPLPTGPQDAGKVPTVKPDGTGYFLKTPSGGDSSVTCQVWDVTVEEDVISYTIPVDDPTAYDYYIYQVSRPSGWSGNLLVKFVRSDKYGTLDFQIAKHQMDGGIIIVRPIDKIPFALSMNYSNTSALNATSSGGDWYAPGANPDPASIIVRNSGGNVAAGTRIVLRGYKFESV